MLLRVINSLRKKVSLNFATFGAEIEEGAQKNHAGEEEEDQEVHEKSFDGASHEGTLLNVEI